MPRTTRSGSSVLLVGVVVRVAVSVGVLVGVAEGVSVGPADLVAVGEGVGAGVVEGVGVLDGGGAFVGAGLAVGDVVLVGLRVGAGVAAGEGVRVGVCVKVGRGVSVGSDTVVAEGWVGEVPASAVASGCGVTRSSSPVPLRLAAKANRTTVVARAAALVHERVRSNCETLRACRRRLGHDSETAVAGRALRMDLGNDFGGLDAF
jgi:hypothetical protein